MTQRDRRVSTNGPLIPDTVYEQVFQWYRTAIDLDREAFCSHFLHLALLSHGEQGGFKRSSQRLESEELRRKQGRVVGLIVRCGLRRGRLVVRRSGAVSIGNGFGKESLVGYRARMPLCRLRLVRGGSARMAGWHHFLWSPFRGAICLLLSEKEIAVLHARNCGVREIARQSDRSPSTISRELRRNAATRSGGMEYRAANAQRHADRSACRLKGREARRGTTSCAGMFRIVSVALSPAPMANWCQYPKWVCRSPSRAPSCRSWCPSRPRRDR